MVKHYTILFAALLIIFTAIIFTACSKENNAKYYMDKGIKEFKARNFDSAIESYGKAIELDPKSAAVYNLLGMAYRFKYEQTRNKDDFEKEIESFNKAIELDPSFWAAMINLGTTFFYSEQKDKSIPFFKKALEINPDHPEKELLIKLIEEFETGSKDKK